jgi:hypothetical protein
MAFSIPVPVALYPAIVKQARVTLLLGTPLSIAALVAFRIDRYDSARALGARSSVLKARVVSIRGSAVT